MSLPELKAPKFPDWNQVIYRLYNTGPFKACNMSEECRAHYMSQCKEFEEKYDFPVSGADLIAQSMQLASKKNLALTTVSEEEILEAYAALEKNRNHFTLIGHTTLPEFLKVSQNAKPLLGLSQPYDLNLPRICGIVDDDYDLYHPLDVHHAVRLGLSAIFISTLPGVIIRPFEDFYEISFKVGYKSPERKKTIRRICHLSNQKGGVTGARHLDLWRVDQGQDQNHHVQAKIETKESGPMREVIQSLFFATNCFLLHLSPRDVILANLIASYDTHEYPDKLNEKCSSALRKPGNYYSNASCATMGRNLNRKINSRIWNSTMGKEYKKIVQNKNLIWKYQQLGILNIPPILEQSVWDELEEKWLQ